MVEPVTIGIKVAGEIGKKINTEFAKGSDSEAIQAMAKEYNKVIDAATASGGSEGSGVPYGNSIDGNSDVFAKYPEELSRDGGEIDLGDIKFPETFEGEIPPFTSCFTGRNDGMESHPTTGVPFVEKEIENPENGQKETHSFPEFKVEFEAQLPENLYKETDATQVAECNKQLKEWCEQNPEKAKEIFSESQLQQIQAGETPKGFTWHHNEDAGKMQLVDSETHQQTGHTGGRAIWGGGTESRN
jgi:hypothetical protein